MTRPDSATPANDSPAPDDRRASLIDYPSQFPIKVMGENVEGFVQAVTAIAVQFDSGFDAASIELRDSKTGKYLGVTVTVTATSREQLDDLYRALSSHPMVKVVL
jgi:putative lipoic acid-binding regulatory protein